VVVASDPDGHNEAAAENVAAYDSKLSQLGAARATQATTLTLRLLQDGLSEGYRVESNGAPLGVIGRTYGVDTSRWYWSLSSISTPLDARGMSHPCGGGADQAEALERLTAHWHAWLATAGLYPDPT
jgi:hypothetical protein